MEGSVSLERMSYSCSGDSEQRAGQASLALVEEVATNGLAIWAAEERPHLALEAEGSAAVVGREQALRA